MSEEKIWYIDRSRNYCYKELENGLQALVKTYKENKGVSLSVDKVIDDLELSGVISPTAKNKYAHLTRFRDHGFIDLNNIPGDSTVDFVDGLLDMDALIIDHFIKRPFYKDRSIPNIKPFVLICCFFSRIMSVTTDKKEYYIDVYECKNHLYKCNNYSDLNDRYIKQIISNRHSDVIVNKTMDDNELTNFSIWFNALKTTALFEPCAAREALIPNYYSKSFFDFISKNAEKFEVTPVCDEKGDSSLQYEYYCNRRKGISEILPKCLKSNVKFEDEDSTITIFNYLFGLKKIKGFRYEKYLKSHDLMFGIYNPLLYVPYLALREMYYQNSFLAEDIYNIIFRKII